MQLPQYCNGSSDNYSVQDCDDYSFIKSDKHHGKSPGKSYRKSYGGFSPRHSYSEASACEGVKGPLQNRIKELEQQLQGLELTEFASS